MPTGAEDKLRAHRHPVALHRAISVWLFRKKNGELQTLLQQRSSDKIVGAGWWANGVCGNVRKDETTDECALRRLREEIGVELSLAPITLGGNQSPLKPNTIDKQYVFQYQAWCNDRYGEHEVDHVYVGWYDDDFDLNPNEVQATRWIAFEQLKKSLEDKLSAEDRLDYFQFPDLTPELNLNELQTATAPITVVIDEESHIIAPWTAMMALSVDPPSSI